MGPEFGRSSIGYDFPAWTPPASTPSNPTTPIQSYNAYSAPYIHTDHQPVLLSPMSTLTPIITSFPTTTTTRHSHNFQTVDDGFLHVPVPTLPPPVYAVSTPRLTAPFSEHIEAQHFVNITAVAGSGTPINHHPRAWLREAQRVSSAAAFYHHLQRPRLYVLGQSDGYGCNTSSRHELVRTPVEEPVRALGEDPATMQRDVEAQHGAQELGPTEQENGTRRPAWNARSCLSWMGKRRKWRKTKILLHYVLPFLFIAVVIVIVALATAGKFG